MREYRTKLGENGRVLIPAACRKELQLKVGEELIVRVEDNELHILSLRDSLKKAQALVRRYAKNQSLVTKLQQMRKEDDRDD